MHIYVRNMIFQKTQRLYTFAEVSIFDYYFGNDCCICRARGIIITHIQIHDIIGIIRAVYLQDMQRIFTIGQRCLTTALLQTPPQHIQIIMVYIRIRSPEIFIIAERQFRCKNAPHRFAAFTQLSMSGYKTMQLTRFLGVKQQMYCCQISKINLRKRLETLLSKNESI